MLYSFVSDKDLIVVCCNLTSLQGWTRAFYFSLKTVVGWARLANVHDLDVGYILVVG